MEAHISHVSSPLSRVTVNTWRRRFIRYITYYLEMQLLVTIISLPILVSWGLAISYLSFVGNLIFAPLFTVFLGLSSTMFFTELLYIPNTWCAYLLDITSSGITLLLNTGSPSWLVGIRQPSPWILYAPIVVLVLLLPTLKRVSHGMRCGILALLLAATLSSYSLTTTVPPMPHTIPNTRDKLIIDRTSDGLILEDRGWLTTRLNPAQYIEFTLRPYLTKTYGTIHFARIIFHRARVRSLTAAHALLDVFPISRIMLPRLKDNIPSYGWHTYAKLKQRAADYGTTLGILRPCAKNEK